MPLSHDLEQSASAVRLMHEAPAADLRASLSSIADLLDRAAHEAALLEAKKPAQALRELTAEAMSSLCRLAVRAASSVVRKTA